MEMKITFVTAVCALSLSSCGANTGATPDCAQVCSHFGAICGAELGCSGFCASFSDQQKQCIASAQSCASATTCIQTTIDAGADSKPMDAVDMSVANHGKLGDLCPCNATDVGDVCEKIGTDSGCELELTCVGRKSTATCTKQCDAIKKDCPNGFDCTLLIINTVNVGTWCKKKLN